MDDILSVTHGSFYLYLYYITGGKHRIMFTLISYYPRTKGHQTELGHFKALQSKRYSNDGETQQKTNNGIDRRKLNTTDHDPDDVDKERTRAYGTIAHVSSERKELETGHLETLDPNRQSDDAQRPHHAKNKP